MKQKHTKYTQINTNKSTHSEMGLVWQNPVQSFWNKCMSLDVTPSKYMPPPFEHSHICTHMTLTFDLWPLKPCQQFPLIWCTIWSKFHVNPSTRRAWV